MNKFENFEKDVTLLINEYNDGGSIRDMSVRYEVSEKFARKILNKHGVVLRTRAESNRTRYGHVINENAFSEIKTEADSYFLGLIVADGCVDRRNRFNMTLKLTDAYMLKKLQDHLGMDYGYSESSVFDKRTKKYYHRAQLSTANPKVIANLRAQNIAANKSTIEKLPNIDWLNDRHFWRGLVDGDGHLKMRETRYSVLVLVGSQEITQGFIDFCKNTVGIKDTVKPKAVQGKNKILHRVQLNTIDARNVVRYLYDESNIHLTRKYAEFLKLRNNNGSD